MNEEEIRRYILQYKDKYTKEQVSIQLIQSGVEKEKIDFIYLDIEKKEKLNFKTIINLILSIIGVLVPFIAIYPLIISYKKIKNTERSLINLITLILSILGLITTILFTLGFFLGFFNSLNNPKIEFDTILSEKSNIEPNGLSSIDKLKIEEVSRCSNNLCIVPEPLISIKDNERIPIYLKIKAFSPETIKCSKNFLNCENFEYTIFSPEGFEVGSNFNLEGEEFIISTNEELSKKYIISTNQKMLKGVYYLTLKIYNGKNEVSKTLTINYE